MTDVKNLDFTTLDDIEEYEKEAQRLISQGYDRSMVDERTWRTIK